MSRTDHPRVGIDVGNGGLRLAAAAILVAALAALVGFDYPKELRHDEAIALLAITGHQLDEGRVEPGESRSLAAVRGWLAFDDQRGFGDLLAGLRQRDYHPPLYYLLAQAWMLPWAPQDGASVASLQRADRRLRLLSGLLLLGAVAVLLATTLRRAEGDHLGPLAAAGVLAVGWYAVYQAHNARPYGLLLVLSAATLLLVASQLRRAEIGLAPMLGLGALLGAGVMTQYTFAAVAGGALLGIAVSRRPGAIRGALLAAAVLLVLTLPWFLYLGDRLLDMPGHLDRPGRPLLSELQAAGHMLWQTGTGLGASPRDWLTAVSHWGMLIAWIAAVVYLVTRRDASDRALGLMLAVPVVLPLAWDLLAGAQLVGYDRTAAVALPLLGWAVGRIAERLFPRRAPVVVLFLIAALALPSAVWLAGDPKNRYLEAGERLEDHAAPVAPATLVVTNAHVRGELLRRIRYLPGDGELLFLPADRLASDLPAGLADHDLVLLLTVCHPCCKGRWPSMGRQRLGAVSAELEARGFRRVGANRPARGGYALWKRAPPRQPAL